MDLRDLIKLAGIVNPEVLNRIQPTAPEADCGCSMEEAEGAGFERATTEPEEEIYDDPLASMGSDADLSLRRYLKAKGDHVTVDENVYPDYTVEDVNEAYTSFKESNKEKVATESLAEAEQPDPKAIIRQRTTELARKANVSMKNVNLDKVYKFIEQRKSLGKGPVNQQPEKIEKLIEYYQNMAFKSNPDYNDRVMDLIYDSVVEMVDEVAPMIHGKNEAKDYGPGKIGAIQKMLDKERDAKKAKIDQSAGITLSDWQAIAARKEELMDAGIEPEEAQDRAAEEMGIDPEELVDWLDANDDLYEAEEGTYMKQWYNYSEDYAMLELYVDGKLVDKWDGYFGANETGNPLQVKFIEMAKENGVDPVGLKVIDGEDGDEGVFTSSGLKWNSNEATESLNDLKQLAGIEEAEIELKPGISIKTDKPGIYKGTKTTSGVVGGKSGEAMYMANRVLDAIEEQDPSSSKEAFTLARKFCKKMGCTDDAKKRVYKELVKMGWTESVDEADLDENAFNQAAAAAARAGKDSFEFNGKTYKTKMDKSTAHKLNDDVDILRKLAGLAQ